MFVFTRFYLRVFADLGEMIRQQKQNVTLAVAAGERAYQIDKVKKIDVYLNFLELEQKK